MSLEVSVRGYLLDTHIAIWALGTPELLTAPARKAVLTGPNFLSVVSYWEVVLKSMRGTLDVGDPRLWWLDALEQLAATPLLLHPRHIAGVCGLPPIHKDPFDRVLIAQSMAERLTLVSQDGAVARYMANGVRVIV